MDHGSPHGFFRAVTEKGRPGDGDAQDRSGQPSILLGWITGLSFEDSIIWALGIKPSSLRETLWSHTHFDLQTIVSLKTQFVLAQGYQTFESFRLVAQEALGGGRSSTAAIPESDAIGSFGELAAAFSNIGGSIG
ncbi:hypothetical protein MESS4_510100 [Mesorhizobium sp. STM 4661]|nr:hypothetical protein MESS4_510100 [Mesorhizobium sp. STM 4661]